MPVLTALPSPTSSAEPPSEEGQDAPIYTEFDEEFEEEPASPIGHCVAIYHFEGMDSPSGALVALVGDGGRGGWHLGLDSVEIRLQQT